MSMPPAGAPPAGPHPAGAPHPAGGPQPGGGPRHAREPEQSRGITRIVATSDLPAGVGALASADGSTVYVSASLSKKARRAALREVLRATHRFPGLVLFPALIEARIRRFIAETGESVSALAQHAASLATGSPVAAVAVSIATVTAVATATAGVVVAAAPSKPPASQQASATGSNSQPVTRPAHRVVIKLPAYPDSYLGAYADGAPNDYAGLETFATDTGVQPDLAVYYSGWGEPFKTDFALAAAEHGAVPLVQMDPRNINITAITAGVYDTYLDTFADAVADFGQQTGQGVVIGFGHEPNASWYSWGYTHVSPAVWVAAWQHIVQVFRSQNAYDVTWLWTINQLTSVSIQDYYPGSDYVTWVGIDAYYRNSTATFSSVFGPTMAAVQQYGKPILLSETAAPPGPDQVRQIRSLFAGILSRQILGFVWFDEDSREAWRLEDHTAAISAFRQAAKGYQ